MKTITLKTDLTNNEGQLIAKGTVMSFESNYMSWYYFKSNGLTLVIRGHYSDDWDNVQVN